MLTFSSEDCSESREGISDQRRAAEPSRVNRGGPWY
jgi:hypothetical protein